MSRLMNTIVDSITEADEPVLQDMLGAVRLILERVRSMKCGGTEAGGAIAIACVMTDYLVAMCDAKMIDFVALRRMSMVILVALNEILPPEVPPEVSLAELITS